MKKLFWSKSKPYFKFIRNKSCLICGHVSEPHHWTKRTWGGMGRKGCDYLTVPLCYEHHAEVHAKGRSSFVEKYRHIDFDWEIIKLLVEFINDI